MDSDSSYAHSPDETAVDPFGTDRLRSAVLQAWRASPTRFREDANAEEDLRLGGYRDRLLVELAQNAADAVASAEPGTLAVHLVDHELRVANTGSPLTAEGVAGLAALRASPKRSESSVGRFGVGFAAVLAVSSEPKIVSSAGGVEFSASRTVETLSEMDIAGAELDARGGEVPVLRLPWPVNEPPPAGFDTEVRLPLRADVNGAALLTAMLEQVSDLLLALPALGEIRIGDRVFTREDRDNDRVLLSGPEGSGEWLVHRSYGRWSDRERADLGVEDRLQSHWWICWAVELSDDGGVRPRSEDVLHAPTPTEQRLSIPARLLATVPLEADRRRVAASRATDVVLEHAADVYPDLVAKVAPSERVRLVPHPEFPLSDVDEKLRHTVLDRLTAGAWLPAANGSELVPRDAVVLEPVPGVEHDLSITHVYGELAELLGGVLDGLLIPELSVPEYRRALRLLEVGGAGPGDVVRAVTGLRRPVEWWRRLYDALAPIERVDRSAREEFMALPVPLADGRTVTGPRDVLLTDEGAESELASLVAGLDVAGLRIADPAVVHPLLERLGARHVGAADLLEVPALVEAVHNSVRDAEDGADVESLADVVLGLVEVAGQREWLGAMALRDRDGEVRRADELLLPDAELLGVLDDRSVGEDAPLGVLHSSIADRWSTNTLHALGVLDSFAVIVEDEPVSAHEGLADTGRWWKESEAAFADQWPPARFVGVRDLDLVASDRWPDALKLLASHPETARALRESAGYTPWWIARFAELSGHAPRFWRLPSAGELAGLYDPVPEQGLSEELLWLAGVRGELTVADEDDAADLAERLGNPERKVRAATALRAHRALADAVSFGGVDAGEVRPPRLVRSISGAVADADRAVVLDEPWLLGVFEAPLVVTGGSPDEFDAEALADALDLPLASEQGVVEVLGEGRPQQWAEVARVPAACELLGVTVPYGSVTLQDGLRVRTAAGERSVHWWVDQLGTIYAERTPDGLARALAWAADRWGDRFAFAALLSDPQPTTLLR